MAVPAEKEVIVMGEAEEDSQDDPTEEYVAGKVDTISIPPVPKASVPSEDSDENEASDWSEGSSASAKAASDWSEGSSASAKAASDWSEASSSKAVSGRSKALSSKAASDWSEVLCSSTVSGRSKALSSKAVSGWSEDSCVKEVSGWSEDSCVKEASEWSEGSSVKEEDFYKAVRLVFDVGTEVMLNLFISSIPPGQTIETFMDSKRHIIDKLRSERILDAHDYDALFAVPINMARFDMRALYLLISKVSSIEPPLGGLNTPSHWLTHPATRYLIKKLTTKRTVIVNRGKLSQSMFKRFWSETESILVGLAGVISQAEVAAVKKKIAKIKEMKHAQVGDKTNIQMWCKHCDVKLDRGPHCNQCGRKLILCCCGYNGSSLCNEALEPSSSLCNFCGTAVPKFNYCWNCEDLVFEQDKHCSNCGKRTITLETRKKNENKLMDVVWDKGIKDKDEESIGTLLDTNMLPSPDQLRKLCEVFGQKNPLVHRICFEIGKEIQSIENDVIKVRHSYRPDSQNDVIFELYLRHPMNHVVKDVLGYRVVTQVFGQYTSEGKDIAEMEIENGLHFSLDQNKQLNQCLEHYSKSLMTEHTNLQMISPSHFKSRSYGLDDPEETMCIVFYVRVKGYIPLGEEPLPDDLDGIPTDVREGGFEFLGKTTDRHVNLKMGCEIAGIGADSGTLGPFFKDDDNLYCLTAAHVLYGLPPPGSTDHVWPLKGLDGGDVKVYQPNLERCASIFEQGHFGSVYFAKYKQGDNLNSGVDVAVIKITDKSRFPNSGKFPENAGSSIGDDLRYTTGDVCEESDLQTNAKVKVLKFGAVTGGTSGFLRFVGTSVRYDDCATSDSGHVVLYKQIEIARFLDERSFAEHGDSGSVVLVSYPGNRNDLRALGLLVGQSSTGSILATPIHAIFDELKVDPKYRRFMSFPDDGTNNVGNVDSGIFPPASSTSLIGDRQRDREEPNFEEIKKEMMENKNETTAIWSEINSLKSKVDNMHTSLRSELNSLNSNMNTKFEEILEQMRK